MHINEKTIYVSGIDWEQKERDGKSIICMFEVLCLNDGDFCPNLVKFYPEKEGYYETAGGCVRNCRNGGGASPAFYRALYELQKTVIKNNKMLFGFLTPEFEFESQKLYPELPLVKRHMDDMTGDLGVSVDKNGCFCIHVWPQSNCSVSGLVVVEIPQEPYIYVYPKLKGLYDALIEDNEKLGDYRGSHI